MLNLESPPYFILPPVPPTWQAVLPDGLGAGLAAFLQQRQASGGIIYPRPDQWLAALERTALPAVKAVILGQDPYHGPGQAHGLAFSVQRPNRPPPSLRNILRELEADVGVPHPGHGDLSAWADQGVLLLNTVLTVEQGQAGSHAGHGWEAVTHRILCSVAERPGHVVFILWGNHARKAADSIDTQRHLVLHSAHPSPLSARHGFFGSRPFSQANAFLAAKGVTPIDWRL